MTNPGNSNSLESDNYPPSIYGNGRTNPTQNLVDAFPMANGYPITDPKSGYDSKNPYAGRDPRLEKYIIVDGAKAGVEEATIWTGNYSGDKATDDNLDRQQGKSTRTGYYMRKLLREDVNVNPTSKTEQKHYTARIRWTELFLAYAEAANEAGGPGTKIGNCKSVKEIIKDIRERAGICVGVTDPYLEECASSKEKMRELIRNERRLELCFENQRFYDLRRWNADLNTTAKGINAASMSIMDVDPRQFQSHMVYGPIPDSEIKKYSNLQQNDGWR